MAPLPRTQDLFARLVNIPTHPDVAGLSNAELAAEIGALTASAAAHATG